MARACTQWTGVGDMDRPDAPDDPRCADRDSPRRHALGHTPRGERAAAQHWQAFVADELDGYADHRNRPDLDVTSRMSAHLRFGTIHVRTMVGDLGCGDGAQSYLRELAFRAFYAAVLYEWPRSAWWKWNTGFDGIRVDEGTTAEERFDAWKRGRTGFPIVDAGMRQLAGAGWMHDRVRMIVASFLVKDLHLPWQWGRAGSSSSWWTAIWPTTSTEPKGVADVNMTHDT